MPLIKSNKITTANIISMGIFDLISKETKFKKKKQLENVKIKGLKIELDICKDEPINEGAKATPAPPKLISSFITSAKKELPDCLKVVIDSKKPNKSGEENTGLV